MSSLISVMVVDDEIELANLYRKYLQRSGFDSVSFTDPQLALENFMQNPNKYSIIILDFLMPTLDGIRLAKMIRNVNNRVKIVLITAYYTDEMMINDEYKDAKIMEIFQKPMRLQEIAHRLMEII